MKRHFDQIRQTRKNVYLLMRELQPTDIVKIPEGFNNNILWNFGHMLITQQILCYRLSGNPMQCSDELIALFAKGSKPSDNISEETFMQLKDLSISSVDTLENDYASGLFKDFQSYESSFGLTLNTIEDAISFNALHESMHLGYIMALRRALL